MCEQRDRLVLALEGNDPTEVERLLASGRSIGERFSLQRTALHIAAGAGAVECVSLLLARGADVEALDAYGNTALFDAVAGKQVEAAARLLAAGAKIQYTYSPEDTPQIRERARMTHQQIMAKSREALPEMFKLIDDVGMSEEELEQTLGPMFVDAVVGPKVKRVVHVAEDLATLQLLVEKYGAEINVCDERGNWPLKTFAEMGNAEVVAWLLGRGAQPDLTDTGATALHGAVAEDHLECARLLLQAGANANQPDVDGCVAMWRVRSNEMLDLLLSFGADPTLGDQCGFKPSHWVEAPELKSRLLALEKTARTTQGRKAK